MDKIMNKIIIALGVALVSATAAFADSSALDAKAPDVFNAASVDQTATGSINTAPILEFRARLGDGSPMYLQNTSVSDSTATSSIDAGYQVQENNRYGDASPVYAQ